MLLKGPADLTTFAKVGSRCDPTSQRCLADRSAVRPWSAEALAEAEGPTLR